MMFDESPSQYLIWENEHWEFRVCHWVNKKVCSYKWCYNFIILKNDHYIPLGFRSSFELWRLLKKVIKRILWVLQVLTSFCKLLQISAGFCNFLQVSAEYCKFLQDFAGSLRSLFASFQRLCNCLVGLVYFEL